MGADCEARAVAEVEDVVGRVLLRPKRDVAGRVLLTPKRDVPGRVLLRPKKDVAGRVGGRDELTWPDEWQRPKRVGPGKLLRPIESKDSGAGRVAG